MNSLLQLRIIQPGDAGKVLLMIVFDKGPCGQQCHHIILLKEMKIDFMCRLNYEEIN